MAHTLFVLKKKSGAGKRKNLLELREAVRNLRRLLTKRPEPVPVRISYGKSFRVNVPVRIVER